MRNSIRKYVYFLSFISLGIVIFILFNEVLYNGVLSDFLNRIFIGQEIYTHIIYSIKRVIIGFVAASVIGISLGFILGMFKKIGFIRYVIEIIRPIPPIAWIPIAILRFGLGDSSAYFIVFIGSFFPIFTNTYFGVTSIPQIYLDVSDNMEINKIDFYFKVIGKYSLPYIFSGLKIGLGMGWMSLIAAELIGAQSGLGYYIQINRLMLDMENIILGMAIIGIIGFGLSYLLSVIERFLIKWK